MAETRKTAAAAPGGTTAEQTPGEQAQTAAAATATTPTPPTESATLAGDDGTPRKLHVAGLQDEFGPIEVPDATDAEGKPLKYTLTRAGVDVAGPHVKYVRDLAAAHGVPLRTTKADEPQS